MKVKLHKQGAQDPRETKSSSEELDNEYDLQFMPNQLSRTLAIRTQSNKPDPKRLELQ